MNTPGPVSTSVPRSSRSSNSPLLLLFCLSAAVFVAGGVTGCNGTKARPISLNLHKMKIGEKEFAVEIAADPGSREVGLMYRSSLNTDRGMLFIFPRPQMQNFWMKNCEMDIDLAYLDDKGKIVDIHLMKKLPEGFTGSPPHYPSSTEVRYVLEMASGWFGEHGVKVGDVVEGYSGPAGVQVR